MCSSSNTKRKIEHWQVITLLLMIYDFAAVTLSYGLALWVRFDCKMSMVEQKFFRHTAKVFCFMRLSA